MTTMSQPMQVLTSQSTQEWYTPHDIIERARVVLGTIDLDPASAELPQTWIKATEYHTLAKPAIKPWCGNVWLNPPFDNAASWVENLEKRYHAQRAVPKALALVNSALGYRWYEKFWVHYPVVCLRDRLYFINEHGQTIGQAKKGQTVIYFGDNYRLFKDTFGDLGRFLLP
jgi:hypothetical protein